MSFETQQAVVSELWQYAVNEADLYPQRQSIEKNLATKKARGEYKHDLAVKAFGHFVEAGSKKYAKEFGGPWHKMFDVPTRRAVAENLTDAFEEEYKLGNYDHLLPKKYQKPAKLSTRSAHSRRMSGDLHQALHDPSALRSASDRQLRDFYREEKRDVSMAKAEGARRGVALHARKRRSAQLDREIARVVPSWRGGR